MTKNGDDPRLVVSQPVLHSVAESLETDLGVVDKVWDYALLVQPAAVPLEQSLWKIPAVIVSCQILSPAAASPRERPTDTESK
jgi:hypothetical protein